MQIETFIVDAFTENVFSGNPAGVCIMNRWLPDETMMNIAAENNCSETAFVISTDDGFDIRWFSPTTEIDLCGHATLASAHVIFRHKNYTQEEVKFNSASGSLFVKQEGDILYLDFPSRSAGPCTIPDILSETLSVEPLEVLAARDYLVLLPSAETVKNLNPEPDLLKMIDKAVIVTAENHDESDFVSRFFALPFGMLEDPVTGSSHCTLIPYWAEKLGKNEMTALQLSKRGGKLYCRNEGDRVKIGGKAVTYLQGFINVQ